MFSYKIGPIFHISFYLFQHYQIKHFFFQTVLNEKLGLWTHIYKNQINVLQNLDYIYIHQTLIKVNLEKTDL